MQFDDLVAFMTIDNDGSMDLLWGAEAIANRIKRTPRQVGHMLATGALPARKIGGRWCCCEADLKAFFSAHPVRGFERGPAA